MKRIHRIGICCLAVFAAQLAANARAEWTAGRVATIEGFQVPECVVVDPETGMAYVSSIVASTEGDDRYWNDDGTGFISRLKPGGQLDRLRWIDSSPEIKLNAPKGMCILKGSLGVTDNSRLVRYSLTGQRPGKVIVVPGAGRLNDMASDGEAVYASDTTEGVVYRVDRDGRRTIKAPEMVNGITFFQGKMYAVSWGLHEVYELDATGEAEPKPFGVAEHFTSLDGIEVLDDGTFIVSDFPGNKVATISADRKTVRTLFELESPADIGLDRRRMLLYVPLFMKDRVEVYQLEKK